MLTFVELSTRKMSELLLLLKMPSHRSVCTAEAVRNFGLTVLPHPPCSSDLAPSDSPHLFILKTACEDPIIQTERHCRTHSQVAAEGGE